MSFKSFLAGSLIALVIGTLTAQFNDILGVVIGVIIGSLVAGTKKSGGAIGFLFSPFILYSNLTLYTLSLMASKAISYIEFGVLIGGSLLNIFTTIIAVVGLVLGVFTAYIYQKITSEQASREASPSPIEG